MQPEFRQSPQGMPRPIFSSPTAADPKEAWSPLRRAGPNGLVSVLTLIVWWGQSLTARTCWQDDSSALWKQAVHDIMEVLHQVKEVSGLGGSKKKRKSMVEKESSSKQYFFSLYDLMNCEANNRQIALVCSFLFLFLFLLPLSSTAYLSRRFFEICAAFIQFSCRFQFFSFFF